jgi:hypothetical protein
VNRNVREEAESLPGNDDQIRARTCHMLCNACYALISATKKESDSQKLFLKQLAQEKT